MRDAVRLIFNGFDLCWGGVALKLQRRQFLHLATGASALPALSRIAWAQAFPSRPVRIVCGFPPGGVNDLHARLISQWLSERLNAQFVVENRTGAGGSIATESVVRAPPDGYTLLLASASDSWNVSLYDNPNSIREISPVASISHFPGILVVRPDFSARTVQELAASAKANPGRISIASGGIGSASHIWWELFKSMTGVIMQHIPYRGEGPAITDLLGGQVDVMIPSTPPSIEHVRAGKLRALAVTAATRVEALPDIPTMSEYVGKYEGSAWVGIGAPKGTPAEIVNRLNREINAGLAEPRIKTRLGELGATVFAGTPADFSAFISEFTDKWGKVIRTANIKL
jgi:tripartite-type tricarboxylate transporter receptor subunit TctC